jgi:5-methylcytosine-specific restriction endonuclease McrA
MARGLGGYRADQLSRAVVEAKGRTCHLFGQPILGRVSADHIIPVSLGGTDDVSNLAPSHLKCNVKRGAKVLPAKLITTTRW